MSSIFDTFLSHGNASDDSTAIIRAEPLPPPRCDVKVRPATIDDLAFLDSLQKMHSHMVGFFPKKQLEANIDGGYILVAESADGEPMGYCIARDQYMKRDDVGIIYQLNVLPMKQRHLVGAVLVKATFERAAYGCKLFSCWCAQDIQANYFWESVGFVPLAFRTGSRAKQRIHIFWQKRIREGDDQTEYWYPSQTQNGAVAEDRIVLPIPPGTHWRDAKPLVLPGITAEPEAPELPKELPGGAAVRPRPEQPEAPKKSAAQRVAMVASQSAHLKGLPPGKAAVMTANGVKYVDRPDYVPPQEDEKPKKKRKKTARRKHDPKQIAAARELRDRYLDEVNSGRLLPSPTEPRYEVSRILGSDADVRVQPGEVRLLDAA